MISAFGVDHGGLISKKDRGYKDDAAAGAAGAGAGALVAPGRRINPGGRKLHPALRDLPDGVHHVDPRLLQRHSQGTSPRFGDTAHVASLGTKIKAKG